jgi:hypothetical protein
MVDVDIDVGDSFDAVVEQPLNGHCEIVVDTEPG